MSSNHDRPPNSRRALRRAVMIRCDVISPRWERPVHCRATDLSPFGVHLAVAPDLSVGEEVVVQFVPPNTDGVELTLFAEVVRVDPESATAGLAFSGASEEETQLLELCLRGLPPPLPPIEDALPMFAEFASRRSSAPPPILI
jgi:hypothetical protein